MQFRFLASVAIFLGSYLPLALILLIQDVNYAALGNGFCWELLARRQVLRHSPTASEIFSGYPCRMRREFLHITCRTIALPAEGSNRYHRSKVHSGWLYNPIRH